MHSILETLENIFSVERKILNYQLVAFKKKQKSFLIQYFSPSPMAGDGAINPSWINGLSIIAHICSDCNSYN